jgi:hypothetical protein
LAAEREIYRTMFGEIDDLSDDYFELSEGVAALRKAASFEALKLYTGAFASSETPMVCKPELRDVCVISSPASAQLQLQWRFNGQSQVMHQLQVIYTYVRR